jgi:hypothetical protein
MELAYRTGYFAIVFQPAKYNDKKTVIANPLGVKQSVIKNIKLI